ncbi:MAG: M1 family aminopeptidase, partial [Blastocatellia bacterium]
MFYYKILLILFLTFLSFYPVMANINIEDTENTIEIGISRQLANKRASIYSDISYKLNYEIKPMAEILLGHIEIELQISNPSEPLILDFKSLGDDPNQLNGTLKNNFLVVNGQNITDFQQVNGHIVIPSKILKAGKNSLELSFNCPVRKSGAAITRYIDKDDNNEYLYSLFVPSDAHMAFPCFDQPDLKARFSLSVTCPPNWTVVTNTPLKGRITDRPQRFQIVAFEETKALSTYLFAFAAGPFSRLEIESSKTPMDLYVRKSKEGKAKSELKEIARLHREGLETLANYFDYPYPFGKCDLVILPEFAYGGMEHAGAIFFREDRMLFPNEPSPNDLLNRASLILHEAAHQWFGNLVTMRWFDDLWLKEGFATFMAYQAMERVFPGNVWKNFYQANKPRAYSTDSTKGTTPIFQEIPNLKDAKSAYGNIVYTKAPSMLRQLEFYLGKETFQKGVQAFLSSYAFSNAEWSDLIKCYEKSAGYSLKTWADSWVKRRAMAVVEPVLTIRAGKISNLTLKQNNILGEDTIWPLKTKLILAYTNQPAIVLTVSLTSTTTVVTDVVGRPKPDYIFANYEDFGYGEFRLDNRSLAYIKSNLVNISDSFLRSLLWGAIWNAVQQGVFPPLEYLELVCQALSKEEDPITLQLVLSNS